MPRYRFNFGEVFPADDVLAEWMATLALGFNDLSLVRVQMGKEQDPKHRWLYWFRLGIAHFAEAATYLRDTSEVPEIAEFIGSLPEDVREHHRRCLERYANQEKAIERIRNEAGFHYPELVVQPGQKRKRSMQQILGALSSESGEIVGGTIGDGRLLFADDVASVLVVRALAGHATPLGDARKVVAQVSIEIEEGIGAFVVFVDGALSRYLRRSIDRGAEVATIPEPS
jgi:hypothetical protein